jgi:hypothetical protein
LDAVDLAIFNEVEGFSLLVTRERSLGEVERGEIFFGSDWLVEVMIRR